MMTPEPPMGPVPGEVVGSFTVTAVVDVPVDRWPLTAGNVAVVPVPAPWVVGVMPR